MKEEEAIIWEVMDYMVEVRGKNMGKVRQWKRKGEVVLLPFN